MKSFITNNLKKVLLISIAIFVLIFSISFYIFYGSTDLFKFPFDSNVWGTASDWCMVIVTLFTALYLVKTFREQKRANDISYSQHRRTIMPKFKLEGKIFGEIRRDGFLRVYVHDNELYDLNVTYFSSTFIHESVSFPRLMTPNTNLVLHFDELNETHTGTRLCCSFTFCDNEGNKYIQNLELQIPGSFRITPPRYLRERF
ncbi:hypothetical protein [Sphingobacterium paramultivorum]|uniref:hypothetical protein n=1 Tax=Sphingobacterium paramultivorum TaxID=2886510 RepID=UPI00129D008D|nr:hypothetical protein [Sphingobacterium paramultivorum]